MTDYILAAGIYLTVLVYVTLRSLRFPIIHDRLVEFHAFDMIRRTGKLLASNNVASCIMTGVLPHIIATRSGIPRELAFRVAPGFFFAAMPAFIFLIARALGLPVPEAIITVLFVVSNYYFLFDSNNGRVGVAAGLLSGLAWVYLQHYFYAGLVLSILLVLGYYAASYYAIVVFGAGWFITGDPTLAAIVIGLLSSVLVWHGYFNALVGRSIATLVQKTITLTDATPVMARVERIKKIYSTGEIPAQATPEEIATARSPGIVSHFLERQEPVIRAALGHGFRDMNIPKKIEFFTSWAILAVLALGIVTSSLPPGWMLLSYIALAVMALSMALPQISVCYGTARIYLASLPFLAPCFVVGLSQISSWTGISGYAILGMLFLPHIATVSGLIYPLFGLRKRARG